MILLKEVVVQVTSYLLGRCHRGKQIQALTLKIRSWNHRHLNITCNTQLALDTLTSRCSLLKLTIGILQQLIGLTLIQCVEYQETREQQESDTEANQTLTIDLVSTLLKLVLALSQLLLFLVGFVDGSHLGSIIAL